MSRDKDYHGGKGNANNFGDKVGNSSEHLGDCISDSTPWKKQKIKVVQKHKETVQISLHNRFSIWEDENVDESEADDDLDHIFGETRD